VTLTVDLWPWKSIGFQTLLSTKYVPSLVKIHWRMLILECSQGCYVVKIWPCDLDLWPWKSLGFQILLRTKYVPSLVKIHWRMLILECSQGLWRTDGSVTISPRNFVGEGIITIPLSRRRMFYIMFNIYILNLLKEPLAINSMAYLVKIWCLKYKKSITFDPVSVCLWAFCLATTKRDISVIQTRSCYRKWLN
jgi:hypothetical protein